VERWAKSDAPKQTAQDCSMKDRADSRAPLSVLAPVRNEAANLRDCVTSVSFAKEIMVVDSESTDGTQSIPEAAGVRVVQFVSNGKFPRKKNWALQNVPWATSLHHTSAWSWRKSANCSGGRSVLTARLKCQWQSGNATDVNRKVKRGNIPKC
jgi:hypothetical protein